MSLASASPDSSVSIWRALTSPGIERIAASASATTLCVALFLAEFDQADIVFQRLGQAFDRRDAVFEALALAHQLLRFQRVVPEAGILGAHIQVFKPLYGLIPVKDASSAGLSPA